MKVYALHLHERPVTLVKFNLDGDFFLTCAKDGEVNLVRTDTGELMGTYNPVGEKPGAVYAIDITKDNQHVVIAGADGKLVFFKFSGEQVQNGVLNHGGILKYVEFNQHPRNQNMVCTCNDKFKSVAEGTIPNRIMIWQWQPSLKRLLSIDDKLPMKATKVKWGPYDESLVSIFEEGTVALWGTGLGDHTAGEQLYLISAHTSPCTGINFDRDRMLMITSSKDMSAKLWAMDQGEPELLKVYKTDRPLNDAAIYPNVNVVDDDEAKYHVLLAGGQDAKDVTTTASSSGKFEAVIWHLIFEEEIGSVKGHFSPINSVAWFPDGRGFVTGAEEGMVRVWHLDNGYFTKKAFE
jgi:translation initiation factor 3 subunit I